MATTEGNILMVQAPETGTFDMKQAVMSKLQDGSHGDIQCGKCQNIGVRYEQQYIRK